MPGERAAKPGLQGERTELSWERTAIGFLAIAAVVLFRQHGPLAEGRTGLAIVAIVMALMTLQISLLRGRRFTRLNAAGEPDVSHSAIAVRLVGWSTACLAALIVFFIVFSV